MGTNLTLLATVLQLYTNQFAVGPPDADGNITVITRVVGQRNSTYVHSSIESLTLSTNVIPSVVQPRPNPQPVTNATPGVATNFLKAVPPYSGTFHPNVRRGPPTNSAAFKRMQEDKARRVKEYQEIDAAPLSYRLKKEEAARTNTPPKAPANAVIK